MKQLLLQEWRRNDGFEKSDLEEKEGIKIQVRKREVESKSAVMKYADLLDGVKVEDKACLQRVLSWPEAPFKSAVDAVSAFKTYETLDCRTNPPKETLLWVRNFKPYTLPLPGITADSGIVDIIRQHFIQNYQNPLFRITMFLISQ